MGVAKRPTFGLLGERIGLVVIPLGLGFTPLSTAVSFGIELAHQDRRLYDFTARLGHHIQHDRIGSENIRI